MNVSDPNNELRELDRFFAETLHEASVKPSEDVWRELELKLDDKRGRRLLPWLMLPLGLIVCFLLGYFFILPAVQKSPDPSASTGNHRSLSPEKTSSASIAAVRPAPADKSVTNAANSIVSSPDVRVSGTSSQKIQLAALKNHSALFPENVAGIEVKAETAGDGLKKYFIEVRDDARGSVELALSNVRKAGYKDAFVVKQNPSETGSSGLLAHESRSNGSPAGKNKAIKTNGAPQANGALAMNDKNRVYDKSSNGTKQADATPKEIPGSPEANPSVANTTSASQKGTNGKAPEAKTDPLNDRNQEPAKGNTTRGDETASSSRNGSSGAGNKSAPGAETTGVQTSIVPAAQNTTAVASTGSENPGAGTTDSLAKEKPETKKTDAAIVAGAVKTPTPEINDSFKRFGLYLLAGPEYMKPLVPSYSEKTALTFNGGLRLQYFISKRFAVELGASYQTAHSSSGGDTLTFAKNLNYNTYVHSTYGDMTVDPATLMSGFSSMAPYNFLKVKYSYQLSYSVLNVPLNLKFYPVKRDKLSVSVTAGLNSQKIISQSAQLVLYKESFNNVLNYNNLLSGKMNFSLLLGLGCELKLYKGLYIVAEPNLRYGFTNMNTTYGVSGNRSKFLYLDGNAGFKIIF